MKSLPEAQRVSLTFELTYACSERCLHCFNEGAARSDLHEEHRLRPDVLTLADYKRIIDEAVALGLSTVTVTGGDPFSYPHCWDILGYLHERNLAVNLFTNAQALNTSEKIRRIARMGLRQFSVSIYSTDAEVHDQITRRPGSWEQSMKVLRELATWPVPLNIKTPVFRLNTRTYYGVREMARKLGAENDVSCLLTPGTDGDVSMIEQLQTRPEALRIILMDKLGKHTIPADGKADGYAFGSERGFPCSANSMITVSPSGVVKGCSNIPLTFGQVHHGPTLQNTVPSNPATIFSVPYTIEGAQQFLAKVKPFVKACELDCGIAARVAIEELVHEIVETNADRKPDETFDVRIIDKETIFTAVLKSKGPLRNPIYKYTDDELMNLDRRDMRRAVMTRMCNDINHKYMNGINCIYLNYSRNKELA